MSNTMKLWERVIEAKLRREIQIYEQQFGFMQGSRHCNVSLLTSRKRMIKCREKNFGNVCV